MKDIDFLPEQYRQRALLRRARGWWVILAAGLGLIMAVSSLAQLWLQRGLAQQLAELQPASLTASEQDANFATLRREVSKREEAATLYVYLLHPWPRSQVIAALVQDVPAGVELHRFHVRVERAKSNDETAAPRKRNVAKQETDKKLPPHIRDLTKLREENDKAQTLVDLQGITTDDSQLHLYVQKLAEHPLLVNARLISISSVETPGKPRHSQFVVQAQVVPGYGQEGGPEMSQPAEEEESAKPVAQREPVPANAESKVSHRGTTSSARTPS